MADRAFFELLAEAGRNSLRAAELLREMVEAWPEEEGERAAKAIAKAEAEGDRITHSIVRRLNAGRRRPPLEREDLYALATTIDDVVDDVEEAADLFALYKIEAPMEQAGELAGVLVAACEQLAGALEALPRMRGLEPYWVEVHRLENEGDRISRDAVASLFSDGIDPMVVIRWKDIFAVLEKAIDSTETVAHIIEGVVI